MKKCGHIALMGPPNAGKSTLLNAILGTKISIVCHKRQTTRTCILGIHMLGETQMIFLDTPGIFKPTKPLEKRMVSVAWNSTVGADALLLMVDATHNVEDHDFQKILKRLRQNETKVDLVLNKVDLVKKETLFAKAQAYMDTGVVSDVFMISAKKGSGLKQLLAHLDKKLPEREWEYPEDQLSTVPQKLLAADITREKLMMQVHAEIPYELTVLPEIWEQMANGVLHIVQTILTAEEGHKSIIIGAGGQRLKAIGQAARLEMEHLFGEKIHLVLHVRTEKGWQERPNYYLETGFGE
jgi:GTP-binding protein Era